MGHPKIDNEEILSEFISSAEMWATRRVAATLLPDVLHYDPTRPAAFPNNGRALADDVVDFFLPILTNGKVKGDNVGPHKDLLAEFPYVSAPHKSRAAKLAA
jgi:hypothetical protein